MTQQKTAQKTFVLDTDVLLTSPFSVYSFDEHNVIVVDATIEDLNRAKDWNSEQGRNARETIRFLEDMAQKGSIINGVPLPGGGTFRIHCKYTATPVPLTWDPNDPQTRILRACKSLDDNVTLVTNNMVMRLKADMLDIRTEPFKTEQMAEVEKQYTGRGELNVPESYLNLLYRNGSAKVEAEMLSQAGADFVENKYFILRDYANPKHTGLAYFRKDWLYKLEEKTAWNLKARNVGQKFALHALLAPPSEIPCVILKGGAGTGKTILSVAAALQGILEDKIYDCCLTSRPNVELDRGIGYLKGDELAKIPVVTRTILDALMQITKVQGAGYKDGIKQESNYAQQLYDQQIIVPQALNFMRGRSIADQFIIIDEAQNMTPHQAFSIISRAGEGSKIVLCGDVQQIDNVALDSRTNGITYASELMKGSQLVAQVTFENSECERSALAAEALRLMSPKGAQ